MQTTSATEVRWSDPATTSNTSNGVTHAYQFFDTDPSATSLQRPGRMLSYSLTGNIVPEPGTIGVVAMGAMGLLARRRRSAAHA